MLHFRLLILTALLFCFYQTQAQPCTPGTAEVIVEIIPDTWPQETTWEIVDGGGNILASGGSVGDTVCIDTSGCNFFNIYDSYGDGIYAPGGYWVYLEGVLIGQGDAFGSFDQVEFSCPQGSTCSSAWNVNLGNYNTSMVNEWYVFVPDSNGQYHITTCDSNFCDSKIWVYDYCSGLQYDNSNQATIYYSDNECGLNAEVFPNLAAGDSVWIRIGEGAGGCLSGIVNWTLSYIGPPSGCMDPNACNYDPLALTDDGSCIYPGNPLCPDGADLEIDEGEFLGTMYLDQLSNADQCLVDEGCVSGYGARSVIRFSTHIRNIGNSDYYIGSPSANPDQFEFDPCHNHEHYEGYAEYLLYDQGGSEVHVGFKNGFCVMDLECDGGGNFQYGCSIMGITAGCGDIYSSGLQCQWIDITDVDTGMYTMVIRVNWDQSPDALGNYETTYENNWAQVCIRIYDNGGVKGYYVEANCPDFVDCAGIPFGPSQPDCNGICNGGAMMGDVNADLQLTEQDASDYVSAIINNSLNPTNCNDLNADGSLTVTDALLVTECVLFNDTSHQHPGGGTSNHGHCDFPSALTNIFDTVHIGIAAVDFSNQYVDIEVMNPNCRVLGLQFELSGLVISSVETLDTVLFNPEIAFNSSGMIIAYSPHEEAMFKLTQPISMFRVYYSGTTASQVCISSFITAVNADYEETILKKMIDCATVPPVMVESNEVISNDIRVFPNPAIGELNVVLSEKISGDYQITVTNNLGQVVYVNTVPQNGRARINLENFTSGAYTVSVSGNNSVYRKPVVIF